MSSPKQRRRGRTGWPLIEADRSAGIPEADRRAIQFAIAEWEGTKRLRRRTKQAAMAAFAKSWRRS
jgi:hypothetical protein